MKLIQSRVSKVRIIASIKLGQALLDIKNVYKMRTVVKYVRMILHSVSVSFLLYSIRTWGIQKRYILTLWNIETWLLIHQLNAKVFSYAKQNHTSLILHKFKKMEENTGVWENVSINLQAGRKYDDW